MKIALIPPIPNLPEFGHGGFHLLLTHLLNDHRYTNHYVEQRSRGAYLVLDNSAHENGKGEDAASLMASAIKLRAQEVVVPDVLFDVRGTVDAAIHAHEVWYEAGHPGMVTLNPALMYVPQGNTEDEWVQCMRELFALQVYSASKRPIRKNFVLGISKDYEMWDGGIMHLIGAHVVPALSRLATRGIYVQVHLLGWGRQLWKLGDLRTSYPWIRSTDSAKPFVYAMAGIKLPGSTERTPPEYPTRPENYFFKKMDIDQIIKAQHNVDVFKSLAL